MKATKDVSQSKECKAFYICKYENKYIIMMADYAVSAKKFDTIEKAEQYIAKRPYEIIINMHFIMNAIYEKNNSHTDSMRNTFSMPDRESENKQQQGNNTSNDNNK